MTSQRILLAEDRDATRERIGEALRASGYHVCAVADGEEALARFEAERIDLVVSDFDMPALDGLALLRAVRRIREVPFILYSAGAPPEVVFRAGRAGALRFLPYPFCVDAQLLPEISAALAPRAQIRRTLYGAARFLGVSPAAERVRAQIRRLGPTPAATLLVERLRDHLLADAGLAEHEHRRGRRVAFAVTEIAESLAEAELFGAERGAYTGALQARAGLVEQADGGTLFLDEIGDAPLALQAKLLRVLETGEVRRVGGEQVRRLAVRVVAATHRDLAVLVREGRFREDLFYRLAQATILVPPLRERAADLDVLAAEFLRESADRLGLPLPFPTPGFLAALRARRWPGNARELRAVLQSALLWWDRAAPLEAADLLAALATFAPALAPEEQAMAESMVAALREARGNQEAARRALGLTRAAWRHRWRRFGLAGASGDDT